MSPRVFAAALAFASLVACGAATRAPDVPRDEPDVRDAGVPEADAPDASPADASAADAAVVVVVPEDAGAIDDTEVDAAIVESDAPPDVPVDAEQQALVRIGRRAFARLCADCHEDGPRLTGRHLSPARVRQQVRQGGTRMRAIPTARLSARELEGIVALLQ